MTEEQVKAIKTKAEKLAEVFGYNITVWSWDLLNVLDAYCIGYKNGHVEAIDANTVNQELVEVLREYVLWDTGELMGLEPTDHIKRRHEMLDKAKELLTKYSKDNEATVD